MDIELIVNDIIDGLTFRKMALKYGVPLSTLHNYCSKDEHSARVKMALEISAQTYDEMAEEGMINAEDEFELKRAKELGYHYRWKSSKRNPKKYGDKLDVTTDGEKIKQVVQIGYGNKDD